MANNIVFYSAEDVSSILMIPLPTLYRLTQQGKIKAVKIGKRWKYKKEDIDNYLAYGTNFSKVPPRICEETVKNGKRREYPRINSNCRCRFAVDLMPLRRLNGEAIVSNLGAGGAFVQKFNDTDDIKENDPVRISFYVKGIAQDSFEVCSAGKILRKTQKGFAVRFKGMPDDLNEKIMGYSR